MAIDVSKFHQTFFEETLEGLEAMETGLLEMEDGSEDDEAINTIFRAAHSIKGGAGTLGFTAMAEFTHLLETILDRRRSGRSEVTQETIDVLLASVDCLRDMLASIQHAEELDDQRVAEVEARLQQLVDGDNALPDSDPEDVPEAGSDAEDVAEAGSDAEGMANADAATGEVEPAGTAGVRITFAPHPNLFCSGNDPVRILSELAELGASEVQADLTALPELEDLDVEVCYSAWTIELHPADETQSIDRAAVTQVFEWVEDEADITVVDLEPETSTDDGGDADADAVNSSVPNETEPEPEPEAERRSGADRRQERSAASPTPTSIRVDIEKVDTLINMVGELVITQSMLQQLATQGDDLDLDRLREGLAELEGNTRELQGSVMQIRMLPISFAFSRLPRLVRDLAAKLDKNVELEIHGETTELDKTVMEKIGDPLVHLIRNSLDHGLESTEERVAAGKPEVGTITLQAYHEGGNIVVQIADDGAGLKTDRILAKARERGLVGPEDRLSEKQIHDLIFQPGFSTADAVSDISGRGVGMDVVKRNIKDLGGIIDVVSEAGVGTTFRIRLPLTLAILDGQLIDVGGQVYIIPLVSIIESLQFDEDLTGALARNASVYRHRDVVIPLIDLRETLEIDTKPATDAEPLLVVVEAEGTRAGLIVDDLLAQQQIVIKSLTTNFRPVPGLSGATILGDGTVAMIIDVNSVVGLYRHRAPSDGQAAVAP